jgi:hypothetical protein
MIQLNMPNIITIALAGMLGYGVLVAIQKVSGMVTGGNAGS